MTEIARPTLEYLVCPDCGTRYLARDQPAAERRGKSARWFLCQRCGKRVRSAEIAWPEFDAAVECT